MINIIFADDSLVFRTQVRSALSQIPYCKVVGSAANGKMALDLIQETQADLLILDLEMPEMNGFQVLKEMKALNLHCKVIVFSAFSKKGAKATLEALSLGAHDFAPKPSFEASGSEANGGETSVDTTAQFPLLPIEKIKAVLLPKIEALFLNSPKLERQASQAKGKPNIAVSAQKSHEKIPEKSPFAESMWKLMRPEMVVIGTSTGGPLVLEQIFSEINSDLSCPIVVVQHMPPVFTATLAERITKLTGIPTQEAHDGETPEAGKIYLAPGDYHLSMEQTQNGRTIFRLNQGEKINFVRPAVDPLFESAARIYKNKCLGFILTGMGADGKIGAQKLKEAGGYVVIQDAESCSVYGMPRAVHEVGAYDKIATPQEIVQLLNEKIAFNIKKVSHG